MNSILSIITIIVSFLAGVFFMSKIEGCNSKKETTCKEQSVKDSVNITYKTHIDTIPFYKKPKSIVTKNTSFDSTLYKDCNIVRYTTTPLRDSLIDGNIITTIRQNQLLEAKFTYKPLFPKYIYRTDSIIKDSIRTTTIHEPYKQSIFFIGGSVGTNDIGVSASYKDKKDLIYGYKFAVTYTGLKTHNIEFKLPLFRTKHKTKK